MLDSWENISLLIVCMCTKIFGNNNNKKKIEKQNFELSIRTHERNVVILCEAHEISIATLFIVYLYLRCK